MYQKRIRVAEERWRLGYRKDEIRSLKNKKKRGKGINGQPQRIFMSLRPMYCAFTKGKEIPPISIPEH